MGEPQLWHPLELDPLLPVDTPVATASNHRRVQIGLVSWRAGVWSDLPEKGPHRRRVAVDTPVASAH